jgi:hypothetical protein
MGQRSYFEYFFYKHFIPKGMKNKMVILICLKENKYQMYQPA